MSDQVTIQIKILPYLKEFIEAKHGNPALASSNTAFGVILKPFLEPIPIGVTVKPVKGNDVLTIIIPKYDNSPGSFQNVYISESNQIEFETAYRSYFKELFFSAVDDKFRLVGSYKKTILQFCSDNNITYTKINYETLKKLYYRYRKKTESDPKKITQKQNIFRRNSSLTCPLFFLL
jgi:hypothetical protein